MHSLKEGTSAKGMDPKAFFEGIGHRDWQLFFDDFQFEHQADFVFRSYTGTAVTRLLI